MGIDQLVSGGDVENPDFESVSTEQIGSARYYVGAFNGSDGDAKLDNALSAATDGDVIILQNNDYVDPRTISKDLTFRGTSVIANSIATRFLGDWTIDGRCTFYDIALKGATWTVNSRSKFTNVASDTIQINANRCVMHGIYFGSVTFQSGTSQNIIDSSTDVRITDNGNNTVGDIA